MVHVKPSKCSTVENSTAIQLSSTRPDQKESREAKDEIPVGAEDIEAETAEVVADTKDKHYQDK
jgi:hypothetical protein